VFLFAVSLVVFGLILYLDFSRSQLEDFDATLYNYATDVANGLDFSVFGGFRIEQKALFGKKKILPFTFGHSVVQIVHSSGEVIAHSGSPASFTFPLDAQDKKALASGKSVVQSLDIGDRSYRAISYPIRREFVPAGLILQVAVTRDQLQKREKKAQIYFFVSIPILLFIVFLLGYYFSSAALAPLNDIIRRANKIQLSNLSQRFTVGPGQDELNLLSQTLNNLFDRLHRSFTSQDEFIANASHQLKTPLAIIKGELDLFKGKPRDAAETEVFVRTMSEEITYLIRIVDDLLLLARVEDGNNALHLLPVQVDDLLLATVSRFEPMAQKSRVKLRVSFSGVTSETESTNYATHGDPELLQTMFQSLLENAIKHSPRDHIVELQISDQSPWIEVSIHNSGDPIPDSDLPRIFERFYRASNQPSPGGIGLGLAIAQKIAQWHGGLIEVTSESSTGTTFLVKIKKF
jgi:signal transduction histidine kinase